MKETQKEIQNKKGFIKLITGPMFSGKTKHLMKEIYYYKKTEKLQKKNNTYIVFKPIIDNRCKKEGSWINTHNSIFHKAIEIKSNEEILDFINKAKIKPKLIFISEINFFPEGFSDILDKIIKKNINIICEGLDKDYLGNYFPEVKKILEKEIKKKVLYTNCYRCFKRADYSKRLNKKTEIILIGGKESYAPCCAEHHKLTI